MTKKKAERVPGMREPRPNRAQRRHPERPETEPPARDDDTPVSAGVPDPRTKTSGHKKKTAENWNQ